MPIVVCGGGAAGMAAAISAARCGQGVFLIEAGGCLGGTVTGALIHTLAGLYDSTGRLLNTGLAEELTDRLAKADPLAGRRRMGRLWVFAVCPDLYGTVVRQWVAEHAQIVVLTETRVTRIVRRANRVIGLELSGPDELCYLDAAAVIDATGTSELARLIDPNLVHDDATPAAAGLIFRLRGVAPGSLDFPRGAAVLRAIRTAAAENRLPAVAAKTWLDAGVHPDEAFVKLFVPLPETWRDQPVQAKAIAEARQVQSAVIGFLRGLPEFAGATLVETGRLGLRDGGRVHGEYCLSSTDVRRCRKFDDAACRCSWPIEYWDPDRGVSVEYLADGDYYEIPLRSLKLAGLENVWTAGKCLSADREARASARCVGTCWAMGESVGQVANLPEAGQIGNLPHGTGKMPVAPNGTPGRRSGCA
jgi:hypothetical protein